MRTVYISGEMTGTADYKGRFAKAEEKIRDELSLTEQDIDEIEDMEMELYNEVVLDDLNQGGMV